LTEFDLRALLEVLHRREVRFVVIGGVAVGAHGYVRGTEDLALVPDPDPDNLHRLTESLKELESTLPTVGRAFDPSTDVGLLRDAVESELLGIPVQICSLARLREMKQAAGRDQDRADLANLPDA